MFREVWTGLDIHLPLARVGASARRVEALGFDGVTVPDVVHDGFLAASAALAATSRLRVRIAGLIAFARSPMVVAVAAWDLRAAYGARFELGLGPLIRSLIVDRYSMPWSPPAPRMREYVLSLRAIFDCWQRGTPLRYVGRHYRFTRMQDYVKPPPLAAGEPPIALAGIGPAMTALAGELASGLTTHPTNSAPAFLREVTLPNLARGAARAGRSRADVRLHVNPFIATGADAAAVARERENARAMLANLYSTPQYWRTLDLLGWGAVGRELHSRVRQGRWDELAPLVTDALLDVLVPAATRAELPRVLADWFGELGDTIAVPVPADTGCDAELAALVAALRKR
jgi:probable F420-dependent oxidoreductase